jgi:hypothetical protein
MPTPAVARGQNYGSLRVVSESSGEFAARVSCNPTLREKYYLPCRRSRYSSNRNRWWVLHCGACGRFTLARADRISARKVYCPCQAGKPLQGQSAIIAHFAGGS